MVQVAGVADAAGQESNQIAAPLKEFNVGFADLVQAVQDLQA